MVDEVSTVKDFLTIEKIGIVGICLYVMDRLLKIIQAQKEKSNGNGESSMKTESRDRILETNNNVKDVQSRQKLMMPDFYTVKNQTNDIHEVVMAKGESGAPKVYNPELHTAIDGLKTAINRLADK